MASLPIAWSESVHERCAIHRVIAFSLSLTSVKLIFVLVAGKNSMVF